MADRLNASTILDDNLAAGRGDKVAVRWGDAEVTYAQVLAQASAAGRALRALGAGREDRVVMVMDDSPSFHAVFLGALRAGAVPVPVNPMMKPDDYAYFVADSGARVVVADAALAGQVRSGLAGARLILANTAAAEADPGDLLAGDMHRLDDLLAEHAGELDPVDTARDDMAFWPYSSGSTGRPKGVVHRHGDILATCETYARHVLAITTDDVTFSSTKLFHSYGLGNSLSFPFWAGATAVIRSGRPTPDGVLDTVERHRPTLLFSAPTLYNAMLRTPGAEGRDLSSVRLCISAAESLPPEVFRRWREMFGVTILDGIGSTELLHIYCSNTVDDLRPGSSGKPVPGYETQLRSPEGEILGRGDTGDLYVRGPSMLREYWRQPEKNARSLTDDGWFFSGDRYRIDADGFHWYEGRADDMMKVSGLWVSPVEIENTLLEHTEVAEAAVVGIEVDGLNKIKAFVVPGAEARPGPVLTTELQQWCKQRLQRNQFPQYIEFLEELPKTATGKIQRYKLRAGA